MHSVQVLRLFDESRQHGWPLLLLLRKLIPARVQDLEINLGTRVTLVRGLNGVCLLETHSALARRPVSRDFKPEPVEAELACGRVCITREEEFCRVLADAGVLKLQLHLGTGTCLFIGLENQLHRGHLGTPPGCPAGREDLCHPECRRLHDPWKLPIPA